NLRYIQCHGKLSPATMDDDLHAPPLESIVAHDSDASSTHVAPFAGTILIVNWLAKLTLRGGRHEYLIPNACRSGSDWRRWAVHRAGAVCSGNTSARRQSQWTPGRR